MPFTPAHPAIVLPFLNVNKRYLSATGLIAGSMVPDIESYIRMDAWDRQSHTILSLFIVDIPVTLVVAIVFHQVVKRNFIGNLPLFLQSRLESVRTFEWMPYLREFPWVFLASAGLGAGSHLFWDSFTHSDGFWVTRLPFYKYTVYYESVNYPMYYALQFICSYAGMFVVLLYVIFMKRLDSKNFKKPSIVYWIIVLIIISGFVYLRFTLVPGRIRFENLTVTIMTAASCAFVLLGNWRFKQLPAA